MQDFEKLGAFYLGRRWDPAAAATSDELVLYDAKDLTTHAVCVGMTGSGKTGLCVALLEEAALDGVPAIVIDPKGDLGNLMLTFPDLDAADFRPWIDESEAARKGMDPEQYAAATARTWREGLARWGQDGERIRRLRSAAEITILTPGSSAGTPVSILRSLSAPPPALTGDADALRERVTASVSGLLALLGIRADPVRSREHILLATVIDQAWRQGRDLDLASLVREIQTPPITRIGVLDLESFYPEKDRFELAMTVNNLLASPGFSAWLEGEPLDVGRLLRSPSGTPRISILSIAHLSESERMFFVTLLLNEVLAWVRTQPGTPSLRAILYMDEVFGFFPPTAEPPSKRPMLTLLKQARAFGLGVVLATQNPVDLDYKGLSNAGTWFLGRLQTERDKERVLDGLAGAAPGALDRQTIGTMLSGLASRVFLLHNVHEDGPVLFHTRWVMSYLRGPLTRAQIHRLAGSEAPAPVPPPPEAPGAPSPAPDHTAEPPLLPPDVPQEIAAPQAFPPPGDPVVYRAALHGRAHLHFVDRRRDVDHWRTVELVADLTGPGTDPWAAARVAAVATAPHPLPGASFAPVPVPAPTARMLAGWRRDLEETLYRRQTLELWRDPATRLLSEPDESRAEFAARIAQQRREARDLEVEKLRASYAPRLATLEGRVRRAEAKLEREQAQVGQQTMQTAISVGATLLGALFGRKVASVGTVGRATTAARGVGRVAREKADVERVRDELEVLRGQLDDLEAELEGRLGEIRAAADGGDLESVEIKPRKSDIDVQTLALLWVPWLQGAAGPLAASAADPAAPAR